MENLESLKVIQKTKNIEKSMPEEAKAAEKASPQLTGQNETSQKIENFKLL